ncbi:hypothetical protein MYU51_013439 [Penicillium brevicompactum]|uniref:uncharacterized protein n=1 Tax=Penicillium brevicompactum TaxID=5074 RepID=UPI002541181E|nr:uncharacterized protein N7506_012024 [Penicillium brevicompactum]KAJ5319320.1 hypothetical protein N7506_012024 [Penicillium brevicompactum]
MVDQQTLHPSMIESPFRSLAIIPPHERIDLFEGISISFNSDSAMTRINPPKRLSEVLANRLQFAVDVLQDIPRMVVTENQTPWSHRQLYKSGMSKDMQDAFACCSLYMARNEINSPVLMSIFDARINELIAAAPPTTPLELLARIHALILYLIMRLFDGGIQTQPSSESLLALLETSVLSLFDYIYIPDPSQPCDILPVSMEPVMSFWDSWVFQESARRTVMMVFYFVKIQHFLHGKPLSTCDGKLGLEHAWYQSAHLWNAQSAFDFAVAWTENQHFIVYNADFTGVLQNARPDDVDLFGKMLLVTKIGIDETKAWFYSRGGAL